MLTLLASLVIYKKGLLKNGLFLHKWKEDFGKKNKKHFAATKKAFQQISKGRENFGFDDSKPDEQEEQKAENFAE